MRKIMTSALLLSAMVGGAQAADLVLTPAPVIYAEPSFVWDGFYAGVILGYGSGTVGFAAVPPAFPATVPAVSGALFGGTLGYNAQWDSFVLGVEGDLAVANITGSAIVGGPVTLTSTVNWLGTLRARAGVSFDPVLIYGTVGVAAGGVTSAAGGFAGATSTTDTQVGWTAGLGVEAMMTESLSVKLEYAYTDLGTKAIAAGALGPGTPATSANPAFHTIKAGVNFHF